MSFEAKIETSSDGGCNYLSTMPPNSHLMAHPMVLMKGPKASNTSLTFSYSPYQPEEETQKLLVDEGVRCRVMEEEDGEELRIKP